MALALMSRKIPIGCLGKFQVFSSKYQVLMGVFGLLE